MRKSHFQLVVEAFNQSSFTQQVRYGKNQYVYLPSDKSRYMYILSKGAIKIGAYASSGQEVMFDCLLPSEFFGNLQFLEGDFFTEFAKALCPVEVLEIPVPQFKQIVGTNPHLTAWFHEVSTLRWWRAENRLFRIASEKPKERIRQMLPSLQELVTDAEGKAYPMLQLLSYQDIADLSGLSRQSAARLLKKFSSKENIPNVTIL